MNIRFEMNKQSKVKKKENQIERKKKKWLKKARRRDSSTISTSNFPNMRSLIYK